MLVMLQQIPATVLEAATEDSDVLRQFFDDGGEDEEGNVERNGKPEDAYFSPGPVETLIFLGKLLLPLILYLNLQQGCCNQQLPSLLLVPILQWQRHH